MKQNHKKTIFCLYLIVLFIILEIALRIFNIPSEYKTHTFPPQFKAEPNTNYIYVNLPNADIPFIYPDNYRGYFNENLTVKHETNTHGFRGPDFLTQKASSTIRIIFLGDSFTFGEGVYLEDTFPEQFKKMAQKNNLFKNNDLEIINLGVGGYNTSQAVALLEEFALDLKPDYIVLSYTLNDAETNLFFIVNENLMRQNREEIVPENISQTLNIPPVISWSKSIKAIWKISINKKQTKKLINYYQSIYKKHQPGWKDTQKALAKLSEISQQNNIPVVITIFPLLYELNDNYPFNNIHALIKQNLDKNQLPYIDLFSYLKNKNASDLWVYPTDQHPNETVHAQIGQILFNYFKALQTN